MDARVFERVAREHKDRVYGHAVWLLRDREEARDVAQEVLVRLWKNLDRVPEEAAKGWLMATTHRLCIDRHRRRAARPELPENPDLPIDDHTPTPDPGPDRLALSGGIGDAIGRALGALVPRDRAVVLMREVEGMAYDEIASALEIPIGTVKASLHRSRERLRERLVREGVRP
ncbi:MAG TPA: RNA polymerase sigma factor [Candidatus Polarisedimenticolaceae bacterium]